MKARVKIYLHICTFSASTKQNQLRLQSIASQANKHYMICRHIQNNNCCMAIIQSPTLAGTPVKNWWTLLKQSFTACLPLLMATSTFGRRRRR